MKQKNDPKDNLLMPSQIKGVKMIQLDMLQKLLNVCKKYNLKIWAEGGTLLGAVRHKGYIPWDDDIDLVMLREDYDKLIDISSKEFQYPLFFQSIETEHNFNRGFARLRRSDTTAIQPIDIWQNFNQGIFIDIFVLDRVPNEEFDRKSLVEQLIRMKMNISNYSYGSLFSRHPFKYIHSKIAINQYNNLKNYYKEIKRLINEHPKRSKNMVSYILYSPKIANDIVFDVEWFSKTEYLKFENIDIPVPSEYDKLLTMIYGDYMTPVKCPTEHGTVIFNTDKSYIEVLKNLRKKSSLKAKLHNFFSV